MYKKPINPFELKKLKEKNTAPNKKSQENSDIPASIEDVKNKLQEIFKYCNDFIMRDIICDKDNKVRFITAYIEGLVDTDFQNRDVIAPLLRAANHITEPSIDTLKNVITNGKLYAETNFNKTVDAILDGSTLIFINNETSAINISIKAPTHRSISEPQTEVTVRGPREGFVENIQINITLLRHKIKSEKFKCEKMEIGTKTKTSVAICYIQEVAQEEIVNTVKRRLQKINTDAILESGYLEQFIEDSPMSLFPTVGNSEKPDKVAAKVLEGRVAIVCDGTPFVLTVPYLLVEALQASEDYYERPFYSSFVRILRVLSFFVSIGFPALYVSLVAFHQNIIPFKLLLTMSASREGIPFSPFLEAMLMIISFEFLREAGIRMPRTVGQTIGIVGGVVLGEATVRAGIASAPLVIVTAITAICSFIIPPFTRVTAIIRILTLVAANITGLFGIAFIMVLLFIQLSTVRSFGVPYLSPISPLNGEDLKDTYVRFPLWSLVTRPRVLTGDNERARYRMKIDNRKKED